MAKITIRPDWAMLLDFETSIPKADEDLVKAQGDPGRESTAVRRAGRAATGQA
jgi:hypothetical protein